MAKPETPRKPPLIADEDFLRCRDMQNYAQGELRNYPLSVAYLGATRAVEALMSEDGPREDA